MHSDFNSDSEYTGSEKPESTADTTRRTNVQSPSGQVITYSASDYQDPVVPRDTDLVQGYIFSQPLPQAEVLGRLGESQPRFRSEGPPR